MYNVFLVPNRTNQTTGVKAPLDAQLFKCSQTFIQVFYLSDTISLSVNRLQRRQVLTWQLSWQHGRQTKVNMDCQQCIFCPKQNNRYERKLLRSRMSTHQSWFRVWSQVFYRVRMSFHTCSFLNTSLNSADHAWCCINSYLSVYSERRSRGDRYDSMVSAVHVFRCCCMFVAS